jgi:hypothetical protein
VSTTAIALVAENFVFALGIAAAYLLLRQGGGLQVKTPPVPKRQPQPAEAPAVEDLSKRRTG